MWVLFRDISPWDDFESMLESLGSTPFLNFWMSKYTWMSFQVWCRFEWQLSTTFIAIDSFRTCFLKTVCSMVSRPISLYTCTGFVCPKRKDRHIACWSWDGFQLTSYRTIRVPAVRLTPSPPARVDTRITSWVPELKAFMCWWRFCNEVDPSIRR